MNQLNDMLIRLIRAGVTGETVEQAQIANVTEERLEELCALAKRHDLSHMLAQGLYKSGMLDMQSETTEKIKNASFTNLIRCEQMMHETRQIYALFEKEKLAFLPLKGSVLRFYYPEPWMRNSCDVDILVHPDNLERAIESLCSNLNYTLKSRNSYDVSLYAPSGMHLELHFALMETRFQASRYLDKFWENAAPVAEGKMEHKLNDDMFYFHQVIHLAKHFVSGGCGIRLFMDLWVLNHHKDFHPTGNYRAFLADVGLAKLEQQARALAEVWFSGTEHTELTQQIEDYVLDSGIYGTVVHAVAVGQLKTGSKNQYAINRIFLPYENIREYYPILKEKKYLTPVYQVKRWIKVVLEGRLKQSVNEINVNNNMDKQVPERICDMLTKLDLMR